MRCELSGELAHSLVQRSRKHVAQMGEIRDAQFVEQAVGAIEYAAHRLRPGRTNRRFGSSSPGSPLDHTRVLVADEAFEPDCRLPQRGLPLACDCMDHAAHQPQRQRIRAAAGIHAGQHHRSRHAGRFAEPARHVDARCRRQ